MKLELAEQIANDILDKLSPHCLRVSIAGSVRRKKPEVHDIEFVLLAKPFETGLFESGVAQIINSFKHIKGNLPCRYAQRELSIGLHPPHEKINIDFFFADEINWGYILCLRTGSKDFNFKYVNNLKERGYRLAGGYVWNGKNKVTINTEEELFQRAGMEYKTPEERI